MAASTSSTSTTSARRSLLDWNTMGIDWQGRGWDRGLRGIAFDGETVYIAASDEQQYVLVEQVNITIALRGASASILSARLPFTSESAMRVR